MAHKNTPKWKNIPRNKNLRNANRRIVNNISREYLEGLISSGILHNNTGSLQGGATNQYYHLSAVEYNVFDIDASADADSIAVADNGDVTLPNDLNVGTDLDVAGNAVIDGNLTVSGTTITLDAENWLVEDKNLTLGNVDTPSDVTADGGGITLKGATDKSIIWDNTNDNWTLNQDVNVPTGKGYKINNVSVLNATTLGSSVVNSSLTNVGTLTALQVDNIKIDSNEITSTFGTINIIPVAGSVINLDAHLWIDKNIITSNSDADTIITAYDGKNITIESVTFDGGVVGGVTDLTLSGTLTDGTASLAAGALSGLVSIAVDNLSLDGNTLSSTSGALNVTPVAGSAAVIDSHFSFDGAVLTGLTDNNTTINAYAGKNITIESVTFDNNVVTATTFSGDLSGTINTATTYDSRVIRSAGTENMWIPAGAMTPTISNGCSPFTSVETTSGSPDLQVMPFAGDVTTYAQFQIAMPKSWNEGTITYYVYWTTTNAGTDTVAWTLEGLASSNSDAIDTGFSNAVTVTDTNTTAEDLLISAVSESLTIQGSPAAGDLCFFRVGRDHDNANDNMTEDARLVGIKIIFTTNATNDA